MMKLPKRDHRLLSSRQFRPVYEKGQRAHTPFFSAFFLSTDDCRQRLGITTTRKIGGAVLRNRCRRRFREIFRSRDIACLAGYGYDIVLNAKPAAATGAFQEIEIAFSQTLLRFRKFLDKENK